ncbi:MAG: hypothetical protein ACREUO_12080 [Burkholderiales bacterium]
MESELSGAIPRRAPAQPLGPGPLVLLAAALLISACGLVYELVAGALASYLIGDTLTRFSTVIGAYLFAMGIGAWLARYLRGDPLEALVHPALAALERPRRVLVLGGGDGLALREVLRYPSIEAVTLVDIDAQVTALFRDNPRFAELNGGALADRRVSIVNADAWRWLEARHADGSAAGLYDAVIMDLPDPSSYALGRIYSVPFFRLLARQLAPQGLIATQATSPVIVREAFWCIVATLEAAGLRAAPYHAHVPSFGDWGFAIASREDYRAPARLPEGLRFLTPQVLKGLFVFSPDIEPVPVEPNRLDTQALVSHYDRGWRRGRE